MSTVITPNLSSKNPYWIEKHRYYELKHFCLQYPIWKKACKALDGLSKAPAGLMLFQKDGRISDPTLQCVEAREFYLKRMRMIEETAANTDQELADYILKGVTEELSYDILLVRYGIPCSKDMYYNRYRKFFYLLNYERQ